MKGFDPKFKDFPDYILGITREIWEDRGIATLNHYYGANMILRTPLGISQGNQGVIASTTQTLHEFPDRQLLGEDVIWSGDPDAGMLSSHRLFCTATHLGSGMFGPATGKPISFRVIADCYAKDNAITDEWLVRDYGAVARQMGTTPEDAARQMIAAEGGPNSARRPFSPEVDMAGPYSGRGNDDDWGKRYEDFLTRIMGADMAVIQTEYDRAVEGSYPGHLTTHGREGVDRFWLGLRSAFPSATFQIHHRIGREDPMMPPRAAVRWSLDGTHDGWGVFGAPTGARVHVMGMSHAEFGPWGLRREVALYDEVAIWKQILLATGDL